MKMNDFSDIFQSRLRLMIISALLSGNKTFKELQTLTGATDGNISVQISKLEVAEFVTVKKSFVGRKPQTTLAITEKGRSEFKKYVRMLSEIVDEADKSVTDAD